MEGQSTSKSSTQMSTEHWEQRLIERRRKDRERKRAKYWAQFPEGEAQRRQAKAQANKTLKIKLSAEFQAQVASARLKELVRGKVRAKASFGEKKLKAMNEAQVELFQSHPGRKALEDLWMKLGADVDTRYNYLIKLAKHILKAQPARCSGEGAIFHFCPSTEELEKEFESGAGPRIIVLRDQKWLSQRKQFSLKAFFDELRNTDPSVKIDVQDLSAPGGEPARKMTVKQVLTRWNPADQNLSPAPINLLNLSSPDEVTPPPLLKHFSLLREAAHAIRGESLSKARYLTVTKSKKIDIDLQECQAFRIAAQAGSISGWHMDNHGPFTWVTAEENSCQASAPESVLKYWAVLALDLMPDNSSREAALADFAEYGELWEPPLEYIRIISLVAGDTLIMPPGTIHAPISVTDCIFRGGMCWSRKNFVSHTLKTWEYIAVNKDSVTNEDPAAQTTAVLNWIERDIEKRPSEYGVRDPTESKEMMRRIKENS